MNILNRVIRWFKHQETLVFFQPWCIVVSHTVYAKAACVVFKASEYNCGYSSGFKWSQKKQKLPLNAVIKGDRRSEKEICMPILGDRKHTERWNMCCSIETMCKVVMAQRRLLNNQECHQQREDVCNGQQARAYSLYNLFEEFSVNNLDGLEDNHKEWVQQWSFYAWAPQGQNIHQQKYIYCDKNRFEEISVV